MLKWMVNNPRANPNDNQKSAITAGYNPDYFTKETPILFQKDLVVSRVIEYLLKKHFDVNSITYETFVEYPELHINQLSDLIDFEDGTWGWWMMYNFIYLSFKSKSEHSNKKMNPKSYKLRKREVKASHKIDLNDISTQTGFLAITKLVEGKDSHIKYYFKPISEELTAFHENQVDQVMKVFAELFKFDVYKAPKLWEIELLDCTKFEKQGVKEPNRSTVINDIKQNVNFDDIKSFPIEDLVDYDNNIKNLIILD